LFVVMSGRNIFKMIQNFKRSRGEKKEEAVEQEMENDQALARQLVGPALAIANTLHADSAAKPLHKEAADVTHAAIEAGRKSVVAAPSPTSFQRSRSASRMLALLDEEYEFKHAGQGELDASSTAADKTTVMSDMLATLAGSEDEAT